MMERIFLGLLCLSGRLVFSSGLLHQYHYVADPMSWTEAQTYCRKTHTDLATIENAKEVNQLISTVSSFGYSSDVWIGLYKNIDWRWSDGYTGTGADYRNWREGSPGDYLCGMGGETDGTLWAWDCTTAYTFICNKGTQQDPSFIHVQINMDWFSAQKYCRENYRDLATVRNDAENQEILKLVVSGQWPWIGLFRDPNSYWSDGSNSSFRHTEVASNPTGSTSVICGTVALQDSGKWRFLQCETRLPFVCYSVPPPPVMRRVVKVRINRGGSSVDLNNPAVKEQILKQLQDRLTEEGVSGVTLKWREQPDGKVFHKEGGSSPKKKRVKTECKTEL